MWQHFLPLVIQLTLLLAQQNCDFSRCNYEGECVLQESRSSCKCIGTTFFKGPRCNEPINNCQQNSCFNRAPCKSVLGLYICGPCAPGYAGTNCSIKEDDIATKLYLHYNRYGYYGEEQKFLITVETLGSAAFGLALNTDNNQIEAFTTFFNDTVDKFQWYRSDDLMRVAQNLGLRHADKLPYRSGFYHVSTGRFWEVGSKELHFVVFDSATPSKIFHNFQYALLIVKPDSLACVPQLEFLHCSNPQQMLYVDIARYNIFLLRVVKRCEQHGRLHYHWRMHTTLGTTLLYDFGTMASPVLKVPPYFFWFNVHGEVLQVYSIQVKGTEYTSQGAVSTVAKCYIFVMTKPVLATIAGGDEREVYTAGYFELDGSQSRDFALSPDIKQGMTYHWDCTSDVDPNNSLCHANISADSKLSISGNALKAGNAYTFNLTVHSRVNIYSVSIAQQMVRIVVDRRPLHIGIKCVRNCLGEKYVPDKLMHLEAQCLSCEQRQSAITYAWSVSGNSVGTKKRLTYKPPSAPVLNVQLAVTSGGRHGKANVKLQQNKAPSGGDCKIQPSSGEEYVTEFHIQCTDFEDSDNDSPLTYQFIADELTLDRTSDSATHIRLPQVSSVKVIICDFLYACTEKAVAISVTPLKVPTNVAAMKRLFQQPENSSQGDSGRIMTLVHILLKGTTSLEVAEYIYAEIKELELRTLLQVEQMADITKTLVSKLKPLDYKRATLFAELFAKMAKGFEFVIIDGEIQELLPENYKTLTDKLVYMLSEFSVQLDKIAVVQSSAREMWNSNNSLQEAHPEFLDLDITVLQHVNAWLRSAEGLHNLLRLIGMVAANMHEPDEEPLVIDINGVTLQVFSIEGTEERQLKTLDNAVVIVMQSALLAELQAQLQTETVTLQILTMRQNPFWWYPDETSVSTGIFYFSVYSKHMHLDAHNNLVHAIEFTMQRVAATAPTTVPKPVRGTLVSYWDMPIYKILIPANSLLLVKFVATNNDLHVALQLSVRPRGYQLHRSTMLVHATSNNATFVLINDEASTQPAYLAIVAAKESDAVATFDFTSELHQCQSFHFRRKDPCWSSSGCLPVLASNDNYNVSCRCRHLSSFAGKVMTSAALNLYSERALLQSVPINWCLVLFYVVIILLLLLLFLYARKDVGQNRDQLTTELSDEDANRDFDIVVRINTGSHWNAGTTANVSLTFIMLIGPPRRFVIYQDPEEPYLTANSICSLKLPLSSTEFALPIKVDVQQDGAGRYPNWYCESFELEDVRSGYRHMFRVQQWVSRNVLQLTAPWQQPPPETKCAIFVRHWQRMHIKWFLFQPLFGPWKYADMPLNRFERTCIWMAKVSVSICIVACYFGRTTIETYEEERERYHSLHFNPWHLLLLGITCYLAGLLAQFGLQYLLLSS